MTILLFACGQMRQPGGVQAKAADRRESCGARLRQIAAAHFAASAAATTLCRLVLAYPRGITYLLAMVRKKASSQIATIEESERAIHVIRGRRVMLDSDLAVLYGVPTHRLNERASRNKDRFPSDFAYQLTQQEFTTLISQIAISKAGRGGRRKLPWAFTEQGVAMLSSVLHSPTAVRVNIEIMRAFVRLRRLMATPGELVEQITKLAKTVQLHDNEIKIISRVLQQMIETPATTRRQIGFHAANKAD
jgi:hypothetical protein